MKSANEKDVVRIELTEEQRAQVKRATGRDGEAVELTVQELEERIAPFGVGYDAGGPELGRLASNHNETLLTDR
jgi:hypothetical protein